jgi:two-component system NtrC family sensor kinase
MKLHPPASLPPEAAGDPGQAPHGAAALAVLRVLLVAGIVVPALLLAIGGVLSWRSHQAAALAYLRQTADIMTEHAVRVFETHRLVAINVDRILGRRDAASVRADEAAIHAEIVALVRSLPQVQDIWVLGPDGRPWVSANVHPMPPIDLSDRAYFRAARDAPDELHVSEILRGRLQDVAFFQLASARRAPDGGFAGVVAISVQPDYFTGFIQRLRRPDEASSVTGGRLIREDGVILARHPGGNTPGARVPRDSLFYEAVRDRPMTASYAARAPHDGQERLTVLRRLPDLPVYVAVSVPTGDAVRRWAREMALYVALGLPGVLALLGMTLVALRRTRASVAAEAARRQEAERRAAAERALARAQRLDALGQLTGGVAHDFNNLLQAVSGGAILLERRLGKPEEVQRLAGLIRHAADRGARLTRQLLAFARRQPLAPEVVEPGALLRGLRELLERTLRGDIRLVITVPDDAWPLVADIGELEVALLNLAVNARDAMPDGGTITISASNLRLRRGEDPDGLEGDFVALAVSDQGTGMAPDVLAKAFEPFFTTKGPGQGTGLGLAQVYGFARQSAGMARIETRPGQGTTVRLLLPRATATAPRAAAPRPAPEPALPATASLRVLVVEDDPQVGALACEMLQQLGHATIRVEGAEAALGALADGRPMDLLLTDVIMPGSMDGIALAAEARRRRPDLPVLLSSGYAGAPNRVAASGFPLLRKPFTLEELAAAIERATRGAEASAG